MQPVTTSLFPTASALAATLLCSLAAAQSNALTDPQAPAAPAAPAVSPLSLQPESGRVFVDAEPDGTLWARGDDWKASFDQTGVTFVPFLGSQRPRSYPLHLSLRAARVGGVALPLQLAAPAQREGQRIEFERGSLVEAYDLRAEHIEQLFVIGQPIAGGALVIEMQVASELSARRQSDGAHTFTNEFGGVRYGCAIAFDANRRQVAVPSSLRGTQLTLTVPAEFVAQASFPLTIDPVVQTFLLGPGPGVMSRFNVDCAYVGTFNGAYAAVYEEVFSGTDHDIYLQPYDRDGLPGAGDYIDYTTSYWATPQVASHRGASQFLVVAARGLPIGTTTIWARTVNYSLLGSSIALAMGAQFAVHSGGSGKNPDVGGDPNPSPPMPGSYCVTWEGQSNGELYYNLVRTNGTLLLAGGGWLDAGFEWVSNPSVSKSCGVGAYTTREWILVWQKRVTLANEDIWGSVIGIDGTVRTLQFLVDASPRSDTVPEVSSLTDLIDGLERFVVVYEREMTSLFLPPQADIVGQLFTGTTSQSGPIDLSSLLLTDLLGDQSSPCVDTDGTRFVIGFHESPSLLTPDTVPYLATVHVINDTLGITAYPEDAGYYAGPDYGVQITSERSGGTFSSRYMAAWNTDSMPPGSSDPLGAFYFGHTSLGPTSYFNQALPGCGSLLLTPSGLPALANTFFLDLTGAQGLPFLLFGNWISPLTLCSGCGLMVDPGTMVAVFTTSLALTVPADSNLIATQFGAQGLDLFATGACTVPVDFSLSNAIVITIL